MNRTRRLTASRRKPGAPKAFIREYEGTLLAALNIATAPAQQALDRVRRYIAKHPAASSYGRAMRLWAATQIEGLATSAEREEIMAELFKLGAPGGGWAIENLIIGTPTFEQCKIDLQRPGDAYATGFIIHVLRQAGVAADDGRLRPAIEHLKSTQRESGRWFVPSFNKRPNHVISNSATAWAIIALADCNAIPELLPAKP
jgi:hypothetical protein